MPLSRRSVGPRKMVASCRGTCGCNKGSNGSSLLAVPIASCGNGLPVNSNNSRYNAARRAINASCWTEPSLKPQGSSVCNHLAQGQLNYYGISRIYLYNYRISRLTTSTSFIKVISVGKAGPCVGVGGGNPSGSVKL